MFCNKDCKKCNHYKELIVEIDGKPSTIYKCLFEAILDSMLRQEYASVRIQSAIESSRNENVKYNNKLNTTLANGFIGLIKSVDEKKKDYIEYHEN